MKKIFILFISIILFSCFNKTYKIGIITNLEGPNSAMGIQAVKIADLTYEIYKKNTKNPLNIEIITIDDSWDLNKIKKSYNIIKEKANIIIFGSTSTVFTAVYDDVIKDDNILGFIFSGTTEFSNIDDNIIRIFMDTESEQKSIANFLTKRVSKKLLIIQENDRNLKYTSQSLDMFLKYYKNNNYELTNFSANKLDLEKVIDKIKKGKFDYAYFIAGGTPREIAIAIQNIKAIDNSIKFLTLPASSDDVLISSLGENQEGVIFSTVSIFDETNPKYKKFIEDFKEYNFTKQNPIDIIVYDQINILIEIFTKLKTDNAKKIKKYLISNEFDGVTGKIKFNQFGDCERELYFFEVKNGKKIFIEN